MSSIERSEIFKLGRRINLEKYQFLFINLKNDIDISQEKNLGSLIIQIPKKHISKSVQRHKLKRIIFEYFRKNKSILVNRNCILRYRPKK